RRKRAPPPAQVLGWASKRADADGRSLERRRVDLQDEDLCWVRTPGGNGKRGRGKKRSPKH
ncbi:hypothetical protein PIB30_074783, partial [Stylosanthes scabra]|nr:hypothetical protein [Stylosanthes scabra]